MRVETGIKPEPFAIQTVGDDAIISFYENPVEVKRKDSTVYAVDEYRLTVPNRPGLAATIQGNLAAWVAKAKAREGIEPQKTVEERVAMVEETLDIMSEVLL